MDVEGKVIRLQRRSDGVSAGSSDHSEVSSVLVQMEGMTTTVASGVHDVVSKLEMQLAAVGELLDAVLDPEAAASMAEQHACLSAALRDIKLAFASVIARCAALQDGIRCRNGSLDGET